MKDFLKKLIASKEARAKELRELVKNSTNVDEVRSLGETLEAVLAELNDAKAQLDAVEADEAKAADNADEGRSAAKAGMEARNINPAGILGFDVSEKREDNTQKEMEARAQKLVDTGKMTIAGAEARAVLVSSGKIATPTQVGGINDGFNKVSSIVDQVNVEDCQGMGEYKVAYQKSDVTAAKTAEGAAITDSDAEFAYATIKPHQVACLTYISNQVLKQSPLSYEAKVRQSALNALRAKAAELIVLGDSDAGFEGITASAIAEKIEVTAIDEKTLRKIAFNYGGNENVEQGAMLYLNKADLVAFGDVRGTDKKPVYKITPSASNPNTGTIEDGGLVVPYTINSKLTALSTATASSTKATPTMVYGQPANFTLGLFSDYEIKVSEDFAFNKNMLTVRGTVDLGGAVCADKGFVVVELPKSGS